MIEYSLPPLSPEFDAVTANSYFWYALNSAKNSPTNVIQFNLEPQVWGKNTFVSMSILTPNSSHISFSPEDKLKLEAVFYDLFKLRQHLFLGSVQKPKAPISHSNPIDYNPVTTPQQPFITLSAQRFKQIIVHLFSGYDESLYSKIDQYLEKLMMEHAVPIKNPHPPHLKSIKI